MGESPDAEVRATDPGPTARIYVCGITPYDAAHLGHVATYLAFDIIQRRWLRDTFRWAKELAPSWLLIRMISLASPRAFACAACPASMDGVMDALDRR